MIASGRSSFEYLQNVYSPKHAGNESLALALMLSERFLNGKGAWRVHGGGFAGTIQAFVPKEMSGAYKEMMESVPGFACNILNIRPFGGIRIM